MSFSLDIKNFAEKTERNIQDVKTSVAIDLFAAIIKSTPVGNPKYWQTPKAPKGYVGGRLRGNWQVSTGRPILTTIPRIDPNGNDTKKEMEQEVQKSVGDQTIYMTNNLPYAVRVEYGHSSQQRPEGMVRVNILAFENAIAEAIRNLPK